MGGYHRFRIGDGPNAKLVWAKDLQEAQRKWQGSKVHAADPEALPTWNVYLVGHGYQSDSHWHDKYAPHPPRLQLQVPQGITVLFYVGPHEFFDNDLEEQVRADNAVALAAVTSDSPDPVAEHILVFPSLKTDFLLPEMVRIMKFDLHLNLDRRVMNPDLAPLRLMAELRDRCGLYVGNPAPMLMPPNQRSSILRNIYLGNYAYLSDILKLIASKHTPTRVHWLACRADYPAASTKFYTQARGRFNAFGDYDNLPPEAEQDVRRALGA